MEKTQVLQEQCSLLSHEGWAPRVGPTMGPTLHVRRGSIAPKTCKNHPLKTCMPQTLLNGIPPSRIESFSWTLTTKKSSYCSVFFLALLKTTVIEELVAALFEMMVQEILLRQLKTGALLIVAIGSLQRWFSKTMVQEALLQRFITAPIGWVQQCPN